MESQSHTHLSMHILCNLDTFFQDSPKTLFLSFSRNFFLCPFFKRMEHADGTLLSCGYLLGGFLYLLHFQRSKNLIAIHQWLHALGTWSLSHWTTREVPRYFLTFIHSKKYISHGNSVHVLCAQGLSRDPLWPHGLQPTRLLCLWDSPGKNSRLPLPSPGDLPNPGIKLASLMSPALAGEFFTPSATWETLTQPYPNVQMK